eukprot:364935-Chlamydomonas_euryale.AAC.16
MTCPACCPFFRQGSYLNLVCVRASALSAAGCRECGGAGSALGVRWECAGSALEHRGIIHVVGGVSRRARRRPARWLIARAACADP